MERQQLSPSVVELEGPFAHELIHARGVRLHVATAGAASDPLVLFLHGSFGGWFDYRGIIDPVARAGFHAAAADMRGFGMSDKPPVEPGQDIRVALGDVAGLIHALGHEDAFIVGSDTGGAVGWALAASQPQRVRGLVSVSSAHPTDLRRAMSQRPWDFGWLSLRAALCRLPYGPRRNPLLRASSYLRELELNTAAGFAPAIEREAQLRYRASQISNADRGILWNHRLRTAVLPLAWADAKVESPVLFTHADQQLWKPLIARTAQRVSGPLTATSIPGAKNSPYLESPGTFAQVLVRWLRPLVGHASPGIDRLA